jgi:hypothetical protein
MSGQRATWASAERIAGKLSDRDWSVIKSLEAARVLTGHQLTRLHFTDLSDLTQHRTRRRVLERLTNLHVVTRLDRVIGGVRAGSTGWVFSLGTAGQRLVQLDANQRGVERIRSPWTPSTLFLRHSLDVAEIYVRLVESARNNNDFELTSFQTEPSCWWPDGLGGFLKPDALAVLSTTRYDELVWLEVDRGTESLPTLKRKLTIYSDFVHRGQLGPSDVFPHVVLSTPTEQRAMAVQAIADVIDPAHEIFTIVPFISITEHLLALAAATVNAPP